MRYRVGTGFDVHSFDKSRSNINNYLILGGVKISHKFSLLAHSDGDVVLHSLTDAILGSIGAGSIGQHFPPNEKKWHNASSSIFVQHACNLMKESDYQINNIDITIICELPKIMPHAEEMKIKIANLVQTSEKNVNVKAVTTEKLGFLGREEGIATQVICSLYKIND